MPITTTIFNCLVRYPSARSRIASICVENGRLMEHSRSSNSLFSRTLTRCRRYDSSCLAEVPSSFAEIPEFFVEMIIEKCISDILPFLRSFRVCLFLPFQLFRPLGLSSLIHTPRRLCEFLIKYL